MNLKLTLFTALAVVTIAPLNAQRLANQPRTYDNDNSNRTVQVNNGNSNITPVTPPKVPNSLSYAGEAVPLDRFEVRERLDRELLTNCFYHTSTTYILKLKDRHFPTIEKILKQNGIPEDFKYLCVAESALQNLRSPAGAEGYWQFLSATARQYGLEVNNDIDERYDLEKATRAACQYFKDAYNKFGSWTAAAASYNCGMGGYNSYSSYQGYSNYYDLLLPEETNRYVFRILSFKLIMENPAKYGFMLDNEDTYKPIRTKTVAVNGGVSNLASWARSQGTSYKMVRLLNPWIHGKTIPSKGKTYYVEIPLDK